MLNVEPAHWKMLGVPGCEWQGEKHRRRGDQAVRLGERHPCGRMIPSPVAGKLALRAIDLDNAQPVKQSIRRRPLVGAEPSVDFLDVDRGGTRDARMLPQRSQPLNRPGSAAEYIDQDRRIQQDWHVSADAPGVSTALSANPVLWVGVPFVADVSQAPKRTFDVVPAPLVVQRASHRGCDERAAPTSSYAPIEIPHDLVIETNVQTHGHRLAHTVI